MPLPEDGGHEAAVYDAGPTFDPYEPEAASPVESVQPTPISPDLSSDPAPDGGTREQTEPRPTEGAQATQEKPLPQFDQRHAEQFVGLLYLGRLTKTFPVYGHKIVARTLTTEHLALIADMVRPHTGVSGPANAESAVYQSAVCAAAVLSVDGQDMPKSLTFSEADDIRHRFDFIMANWMPPVREKIYEECVDLEVTARKALAALGEASG